MRKPDLTSLSERDLVVQEHELAQTLAGNRLRHALGQLERNSDIRAMRRQRARFLTEIRRRELELGLEQGGIAERHASALGSTEREPKVEASQKKPEGLLASLRRRLTGTSENS